MRTYRLTRIGSKKFGTLGILRLITSDGYKFVCLTLEPEMFAIPEGEYVCRIYKEGGHPFPVFRVLAVPGHTYIEIHPGNWAKDTGGCILLGEWFGVIEGVFGMSESKTAFKAFMDGQGEEDFQLRVV